LTGSGQPGFMDKLRQSLQIDVLEFESGQGEDAGPVVGVGKYLNESIFFKVEKGLEEDTGRVSVEVDITPQVSVETQAGSVTQSFEVKWKYSY
jgi:autotransporter translocation and assembly factor TamB